MFSAYTQKYQAILNILPDAKNILLLTHQHPDGDALGSLLACYVFLTTQNKKVEMLIKDELPKQFNFLPYFNLIKNNDKIILDKKYDLVFVLDCGAFDRLDIAAELLDRSTLINIDHHGTNDSFGAINLVDTTCSSTCEILFNFFKCAKYKLDTKLSNLLLTGIVTDTDYFINPNTSEKTFAAVSHLLRRGAKLNLVFNKVYQQSKIRQLKLWGTVLSRLQPDKQSGLVTTAVFQDDLENANFDDNVLTGLANFLNSLGEYNGALVLKEESGGVVRGNLRTTREDVDVAQIAQEYGGGGHKKAAGFKTKGKIIQNSEGVWMVDKT